MPTTMFGRRIKHARIDSNLRLKDMALQLGVTSSYINKMESGTAHISDDWVVKLQEFFGLRGIALTDLVLLADLSNGVVRINKLSFEHQLLVVKLAHGAFTEDELSRINTLLGLLP